MLIGACMFHIIIGYSFTNKIVMNFYAVFVMTYYQFTSDSDNILFHILFAIFILFLSTFKEYVDEKQKRKLYICS